MHMLSRILAVCLLPLILAGCATVTTGEGQYVTVHVTCKGHQANAYCLASNAKGTWSFYAPEKKFVLRDGSPLRISCQSPMVGDFGIDQYPWINAAMFGNIISGGLVGAAIDVSNKSVWAYPNVISVESEFCKRFKN